MFTIIGERAKAVSDSHTNLCLKCSNYVARTYALTDREERICMVNYNKPTRLSGPVSRCTEFYDRHSSSKKDLESMAYIIETSKRTVGFGAEMDIKFVAPSERKKESEY